LVDDHEVVRRGLRELLESEPDFVVVAEGADVAEGVRRIGAVRPDVAILDVELPDGTGVDICREVKSRWPEVGCLMLTSHNGDTALFDSIIAGADGYVLKQVHGNELISAIRTVAGGHSILDPEVTRRVLDRLRNGPPEDALLSSLTERELVMVRQIGEGKTNRQIAEHLHLAEKTVKNNLSVVLSKMGMQRRTELAAYIARTQARDSSG